MKQKLSDYILKSLRAFIAGENVDFDTSVDIEELFNLAKEQQVAGIAYNVINDKSALGAKDSLFKKTLFDTIRLSMTQEQESKRLASFCEQNGYELAFLKGMEIKYLYPVPELRVMGDIDVLINEKNMSSIGEFLMLNGYKLGDAEGFVFSYSKGVVTFELHKALNQYAGVTMFDHRDIVGNKLEDNKHFAFLISHLAKHMDSAGCGVRMLFDIAIFCKFKQVDMNKVMDYLRPVGLESFCIKIMGVVNKWFDCGMDYDCDEVFANEFKGYVFGNGVYGFEHLSIWELKQARSGGKLKTLFRLIFPTIADMKSYYPQVAKRPWLVGLYYVKRWFVRMKLLKKVRKRQEKLTQKGTHEKANLGQIEYIRKELGL